MGIDFQRSRARDFVRSPVFERNGPEEYGQVVLSWVALNFDQSIGDFNAQVQAGLADAIPLLEALPFPGPGKAVYFAHSFNSGRIVEFGRWNYKPSAILSTRWLHTPGGANIFIWVSKFWQAETQTCLVTTGTLDPLTGVDPANWATQDTVIASIKSDSPSPVAVQYPGGVVMPPSYTGGRFYLVDGVQNACRRFTAAFNGGVVAPHPACTLV